VSGFVTVTVAGQMLGIAVGEIEEVVRLAGLTPVPRAPAMVAGLMNLRGRIVTAIDLRVPLDLPPRGAGTPAMCVIVAHGGDPYALLVDTVGEVMPDGAVDAVPATLDARWRSVMRGIARGEALIPLLDVAALFSAELAAA
jgi:purine-binding chemotaxis protein CheW